MSNHLTSTTLIQRIKLRGMIPTSQNTFTNQGFLDLANDEMQLGVIPSILKYHEEFFLTQSETSLVGDQSSYLIPERAIGSKLRDVFFKDEQGNKFEMTRVTPEDQAYYEYNSGSRYNKFYFRDGKIQLIPDVESTVTGSLLFEYYKHPGMLVLESKVGVVTVINTVTGEVTVSSLPSEFTTSTPLDFIQKNSPHQTLGLDKTPTAVTTGTKIITFSTSDLPSTLAVGDHIALAGESFIPQIPDELHSLLSQRVVCRCLEALGTTQDLQNANAKLAEMEDKMSTLIDNRCEGAPQKINNRHSILKMSKINRRGIRSY